MAQARDFNDSGTPPPGVVRYEIQRHMMQDGRAGTRDAAMERPYQVQFQADGGGNRPDYGFQRFQADLPTKADLRNRLERSTPDGDDPKPLGGETDATSRETKQENGGVLRNPFREPKGPPIAARETLPPCISSKRRTYCARKSRSACSSAVT